MYLQLSSVASCDTLRVSCCNSPRKRYNLVMISSHYKILLLDVYEEARGGAREAQEEELERCNRRS